MKALLVRELGHMRHRRAVASPPLGWRLVRGRFVAFVAVSLAAASVVYGCRGRGSSQSPDPRPVLGAVVVNRAAAATVAGESIRVDDAALAAKARDALARAGIFALTGVTGKEPRANVAIAIDALGEGEPPDPEIAVEVRVRIEVVPSGAGTARYGEDAAAVGQVPAGHGVVYLGAAFQRLAERTTEDLLLAYAERQRLWLAADADVARALASDNPELRLEAIRIAGTRKLRAQLPTLIHLLTDVDEATRDAALGAVVVMGDRTAVRALTESRQMRDGYEMTKILDAVATLGGQEASDYLSFVSETHDDPDVRKVAKAALDRLRKHYVTYGPTK